MVISKNFTIDDIHKIRYENYEKTKHLTAEELIEKTRSEAKAGRELLAELKEKKALKA